MSDPYREGVPPSGLLDCPRCKKSLPPMDIATCPDECGTWVNASVAHVAFQPDEVAENRITRWWRVREPCPVCKEQMRLRGSEDHELFQGCDKHGYWIDVDTVGKTSLGRPGLLARLKKMREEEEALAALMAEKREKALQAAKEREEQRQAEERAQREKREATARAKEEARKEAERKEQEKQRKAAEKQLREQEKQRRREQAKREKTEARRRARELEEQLHEERRARIVTTVTEAFAANDPGPLVNEVLKLDRLVVELTKRVADLERYTVKFEREGDDE